MKQNKSKDIHIMMDVETTSNNQFDTMLLQIAMVAFDYETGEYLDTFNAILDTDYYPKLTFNTNTLKFWLGNAEVLSELLTEDRESEALYLSEVAMIRHAINWINNFKKDRIFPTSIPSNVTDKYEGVYLWGNGENFDNTIFHHKCHEFGFDYPIDYNKDMDVRTHMKTLASLLGKQSSDFKDFSLNENLHNAIADCKFQIDYLLKVRNEVRLRLK